MQLQDIFYITGIIFFGLSVLILLVIGILLFYIRQKVTEIHDHIEARIDDVFGTAKRSVKTAADITASLLPGSNKKSAKKRR